MQTVMGVFGSRERAEEAVKELLDNHVPQDAIVFLTRSESDATTLRKSLGTLVGGLVGGGAGVTAGVVAATLFSIPGIGQVFALGVGATAALGVAGAAVGKALSSKPNSSLEKPMDVPQATPNERAREDLAFLGEVLRSGRSLILVRTDWPKIAEAATAILDRMGISSQWRASEKIQTAVRQIGGISVVDVWGGITLGPNSTMLRQVVSDLLEKGRKNILLNLRGVEYIDSAGLGELVRTYTTLKKLGGQFKIVNRNPRVQGLFKATGLHKVFDVHEYEATAIPSFGPLTGEISRYSSIP